MSHPQSEGTIHISSIALNVQPQIGTTVDHIVFQTGSFKKDIEVEVSPDHEHDEVFDPALELSPQDRLSISVQSQSQQGERSTLIITVDPSEVMAGVQDDGHEKKEYFKSHNNIEVAIGFSCYSPPSEISFDVPVPPSDILRICPRLRLLVIGNSGAGKSTLIKKLFGVKNVDISDSRRGQADIDKELVAANNIPFVLHDTLGFEAGDRTNLERVKRFVNERQEEENLKDRLHAVWVCLAVPYAKGRFTEAGTEEFLRDRKNILGDIPIVVALTQLDLLDKSVILSVRAEGKLVKSVEEARPYVEPRRAKFLHDWCTLPLQKAAQGDVPHIAVSTESEFGLEPTLTELLKVTTSKIEKYIRADPSYALLTGQPSITREDEETL